MQKNRAVNSTLSLFSYSAREISPIDPEVDAVTHELAAIATET